MDEDTGIYIENTKYDYPDPLPVREHVHKPVLGHRLFRWTMLRIRLNNTMGKDLLDKIKINQEIRQSLKSDEVNTTLHFLADPNIENAGAAMQKKFGEGMMLNNFYFLFGLPRVVKIVGNAYKEFGSELSETKDIDSVLGNEREETNKFEQERKKEEIKELGRSRQKEHFDDLRVSRQREDNSRLGASRRYDDAFDDQKEKFVDLRASRKPEEYFHFGASRRKDDATDIHRQRDDQNELGVSRRRRDDKDPLGRSRKPNDYELGASRRPQQGGFREIRASGRYEEYEEPDDNRLRKTEKDELRFSRRPKDEFDRHGTEFSELGKSKRTEKSRDHELYERRDENREYRLSKGEKEYERVIMRREGVSQRREAPRGSHRREFESGIEDALWQLDKTLNEHD